MATSINFPTYGFINNRFALNEENWRKFFKPFVYDSVQNGLATTAGTGMTINVSGGECRCGAVMGVLDGAIALDINNGHATYNRIDSVVVQYSYGAPSTLSVAVKRGTASANPVAPTLSKVYNTLWEMEIAQVLVPAGATDSSSLTITDKRVMYDSVQSIIDDNAGDGDTDVVWSADKSYDQITDLNNSSFTLQSSNITAIPANSDLNDYTTPGNYGVTSIATAMTITNIPYPLGGRLIVMHLDTSTNIEQIYIDNESGIFSRSKDNTGWTDWNHKLNILNKIKYNEKFSPVFQMIQSKIISDVNGRISNSTSKNVCADEIYYPLESEKKYIFWSDKILYNIYFYNENFSFKERIYPNNNVKSNPIIYINTNNYAYFRVGGYYSPLESNVLNTLHVTMTNNPKKVVCLGDSITAGIGANIAYHMYLARHTGWTCQNWGVGGSGWATRGSNNTKVGNGIEGIPSNNSTPEYNTEFTAAVEVIPKDADLYVVFGGYNDWNTDKSETVFTNAVNTTISYIQENMPSSRILVMTPTQRYKVDGKDGNTKNNAGLTIKNYCQIIKNVCEDHSVPCLDLYSTSLLYPYSAANSTEYFADDGAHINDNGHKLVFEAMTEKTTSLLALK